jgi:hypothetical protein
MIETSATGPEIFRRPLATRDLAVHDRTGSGVTLVASERGCRRWRFPNLGRSETRTGSGLF